MGEYVLNRDLGATDEIGFSHFLQALFGQGVINIRTPAAWAATQKSGGANMSVDVAAGDGFISINNYLHVAFSDAVKNVSVNTADPSNPRIDTLVAYIDRGVQSPTPSNNPGALKFKAVAGVPAGSPVAPNNAAITASIVAGNPYIALADIAVGTGAINIINANITDRRVSLALAAKLWGGATNTTGHTVPNVADDTVALLNAVQSFANKTFTAAVLNSPTIQGTPTITGWDGWSALGFTPNSVTCLGNRSYSVVINGQNLTNILSPGMRLRSTRTTLAPNQCASLDGATQYFVKTTPNKASFTDDYATVAWIKASSYAAGGIISRYNGTSGWAMRMNADGTIELFATNASAANFSSVKSYQSVPLNKWVHVVAQQDMSAFTATPTTSYIMFDGVDVPAVVSRGGTNPTALVQAGNLEVGSLNAGNFFPGKIAQAGFFTAKVTQSTMRGYISQGYTGAETSAGSLYSLSNSLVDLNTTTPNDLSVGAGGATTTTADSPFGGQGNGTISTTLDYGVIQSVSFSTNTTITVQVAEGCTIPTSGTVAALAYGIDNPYQFPGEKTKWRIESLSKLDALQASPTNGVWYNPNNHQLSVPIGSWELKGEGNAQNTRVGAAILSLFSTLSTGNNNETEPELTSYTLINSAQVLEVSGPFSKSKQITQAAATPWYLNVKTVDTTSSIRFRGDLGVTKIIAQNAYVH